MTLRLPGPGLAVLAIAASVLLGCRDRPRETAPGTAPSAPSPSGSVVSAPIGPETELMPDPQPRPNLLDGGPGVNGDRTRTARKEPPRPLREDVAPPRDPLRGNEAVGFSLEAQWQWHATPAPHGGAEVAKEGIAAARDRTALTVAVDVSPIGRMRWVFVGRAFPLPANTELRARDDRYGHLLVWPDRRQYRVLPAGTMRAVLSERRPDTTPLAPGTVREQEPGSALGFETTRVQIESQLGTFLLEQAPVPGAGAGAPLLCRLLVELVGVEPSSPACTDGQLPLRAEYQWPDGGKLGFMVTTLLRGQELQLDDLLAPPPDAGFRPDGLPPQASGVLLSEEQLARFRTRAVEATAEPDGGAPEQGVLAANQSDLLQYLLLDGVPVSWVEPRTEQHVVGPRAGRYVVSWRDFLGLSVEPPRPVDVPCRVVVGEQVDAGPEPQP
jgi:hypothetical protein